MEEIKRMDLTKFRDEGFLQEVNRLFFHPLGLALEVYVNEDGTVDGLGGVWDYRDDPEGMFFSDQTLSEEKIRKVEELRMSKILNRVVYGEKHSDIYVDGTGIQGKRGE